MLYLLLAVFSLAGEAEAVLTSGIGRGTEGGRDDGIGGMFADTLLLGCGGRGSEYCSLGVWLRLPCCLSL